MQRYAVLDGLRGYFLVFMLINHLALLHQRWAARPVARPAVARPAPAAKPGDVAAMRG